MRLSCIMFTSHVKTRLEKPAVRSRGDTASIKWQETCRLAFFASRIQRGTATCQAGFCGRSENRHGNIYCGPKDSYSPLTCMIVFLHRAKHELPRRNTAPGKWCFSVIVGISTQILYSINLSTFPALKIDGDRGL